MSTLTPPSKISQKQKKQELREDAIVTTYAKGLSFYDNNKNLIIAAGVVVVLLIAGFFGWSYMQGQKENTAQAALSDAVRAYEAGNFQQALDGVNGAMGLAAVADEYGSTDAGNLAAFYAADANFQLGNYDAALDYYEDFDADANIVGASAIAGRADILMIQGNHAEAASLYERAASIYASDFTTPTYLVKAGEAHEAAGNYADAVDAYGTVLEDYADQAASLNVEVLLARAKARLGN
ncbi:MAG: tetratricopeptide repeat protein [Rhodothermales bacterium]